MWKVALMQLRRLSRQSEKFLTGQSRKFLLTAVRLKDGTNRDEPRGTGPVGLVEASGRQEDDPTRGGRADGSQRPVGAQAIEADETGGRPCGCAWATGAGIEPQDRAEGASSGHRDCKAAGLARLWTDLRL